MRISAQNERSKPELLFLSDASKLQIAFIWNLWGEAVPRIVKLTICANKQQRNACHTSNCETVNKSDWNAGHISCEMIGSYSLRLVGLAKDLLTHCKTTFTKQPEKSNVFPLQLFLNVGATSLLMKRIETCTSEEGKNVTTISKQNGIAFKAKQEGNWKLVVHQSADVTRMCRDGWTAYIQMLKMAL